MLLQDLLAAVTATIDPGASKDAPAETAKRLGTLREEFFAKCNDLIDELVSDAFLQKQRLQLLGNASAVQLLVPGRSGRACMLVHA